MTARSKAKRNLFAIVLVFLVAVFYLVHLDTHRDSATPTGGIFFGEGRRFEIINGCDVPIDFQSAPDDQLDDEYWAPIAVSGRIRSHTLSTRRPEDNRFAVSNVVPWVIPELRSSTTTVVPIPERVVRWVTPHVWSVPVKGEDCPAG